MSDYALAISEVEVQRYRLMAEFAKSEEGGAWAAAGITAGAVIADVGCGPAATSVVMAETVGPSGRVIGVERDPTSLQHAHQVVAASGMTNMELREGEATATGIAPGSVDVAVMRHVLAHNGGREQDIVNHLATLLRPGGHVYLVDVDLTGMRARDADPDLSDIFEKYAEFHRQRGNDPLVGLQLDRFVHAAGLEVVQFGGAYTIIAMPPGLRPPPWIARDLMLAAGVVTQGDIDRWGAALERMDARPDRPTMFATRFWAVGRRPEG
ncbi:MAG: methyltransferase domain-containing protein [Actinomycetes bacterium]